MLSADCESCRMRVGSEPSGRRSSRLRADDGAALARPGRRHLERQAGIADIGDPGGEPGLAHDPVLAVL
jgi:hypothetical protein